MTGEFPAVPFEIETKKFGKVTVTAVNPSDKGGLVEVDDGDHAPFWVRAKTILGIDVYRVPTWQKS